MNDPVVTAAAVASAVGALAAVLTSLWLQLWRAQRRRPSLSLTLSEVLDAQDWSALDFDMSGVREVWLRMKVWNKPGRDQAEDAEVFLLRAENRDDGRVVSHVGSRNLKWADLTEQRISVPAGLWRRVDVAFLDCPPDEDQRPSLYLPLYPWRDLLGHTRRHEHLNTMNQLPDPGRYRLTLALSARNCDATFYEVDLEYDAVRETTAVALKRHIRVTRLERVRSHLE